MKIIKLLFIAILFLNFSCTVSQNSKREWIEDLEFLKKELPEKHINLFHALSEEEYISLLDELISKIDTLSYNEIIFGIQKIIARIKDPHTLLEFGSYSTDELLLYPFRTYWIKEGIIIININEKNKELLGCRLIAINDFPIDSVISKLSNVYYLENEATIKNNISVILINASLLKYLNISEIDKAELLVINNNGDTVRSMVNSVNFEEYKYIKYKKLDSKNIPMYMQNSRQWWWYKYFKNDKMLFFKYNRCLSKDDPIFKGKSIEKSDKYQTFTEFTNEIFDLFESEKIDKLIVDMRHNSGGSSLQGKKFIERLSKNENINKKGSLYVIVGRKTFSSAILNVMEFKGSTEAIIIGEPTSGSPNHYGEAKSFELPNSKIEIKYSTKYFKRAYDDINTIIPDIIIENTLDDLIEGRDPVLEYILKQ